MDCLGVLAHRCPLRFGSSDAMQWQASVAGIHQGGHPSHLFVAEGALEQVHLLGIGFIEHIVQFVQIKQLARYLLVIEDALANRWVALDSSNRQSLRR